MHQIIWVTSVIFPVFSLILLGFIASKKSWIPNNSSKSLNSYVVNFALPSLLFMGVINAPASEILNFHFIFSNFGAAIICFVIATTISYFIFNVPYRSIPLRGMVSCYGTMGYMGIPLISMAYGKKMMFYASYGTLLHSIPLIILVILMFELQDSNKNTGVMTICRDLGKAVFLNPLVIAVILGLFLSLQHIIMPAILLTTIKMLSYSASPCALFALGANLTTKPDKAYKIIGNIELAFLVFLKLVAQPFLTYVLIKKFLPMQQELLKVSLILSALPTGTVAYLLAEKYGSDIAATSKVIVISMLLSLVSLSYILWLHF